MESRAARPRQFGSKAERPRAGPLRLSPAALARIDGDAVSLEHEIVLVTLVVEDEAVLEPGAPAARDRDPQKCASDLFLNLQFRDAARGILVDYGFSFPAPAPGGPGRC